MKVTTRNFKLGTSSFSRLHTSLRVLYTGKEYFTMIPKMGTFAGENRLLRIR